ncbi:MAG: hypothetical protein ACSHX7_04050 [Luteolibacter sp.]
MICILLGYLVGKKSSASETKDLLTTPKATAHTSSQSRRDNRHGNSGDTDVLSSLLNGRDIQELPHSELSEIISQLAKYDHDLDPLTRAKRSYQLQLLLEKIPADQLEKIATSMKNETDRDARAGLNSIVSAMASKDSFRALDWVSRQENSSNLFSTVISRIAENDPTTAANLFREGLVNGQITNYRIWSASQSISRAMAKLGSESLIAFADSLPQRKQSNTLYSAIQALPDEEIFKTIDTLYTRSKEEGNFDTDKFEHVFSSMASGNFEKAEEWLEKLPEGEEKAGLLAKTAENLHRSGDTERSLELMRQAITLSPGNEKELLQTGMRHMIYINPEAIPEFASLLPDGVEFEAKDLNSMANNAMHYGANGITAIANAIRNPDEQAKLITSTLNRAVSEENSSYAFNTNDFNILSSRIDAMGFTGENATKVHTAIEKLRKKLLEPKE